MKTLLTIITLLLACSLAEAEMYRWVAEIGSNKMSGFSPETLEYNLNNSR